MNSTISHYRGSDMQVALPEQAATCSGHSYCAICGYKVAPGPGHAEQHALSHVPAVFVARHNDEELYLANTAESLKATIGGYVTVYWRGPGYYLASQSDDDGNIRVIAAKVGDGDVALVDDAITELTAWRAALAAALEADQ